MRQQKSKLVEDFEDMTSDRIIPNIEKFTKAVHTRFKSQNVFLEYTHYGIELCLLTLFQTLIIYFAIDILISRSPEIC